jgi:hypothetical protein
MANDKPKKRKYHFGSKAFYWSLYGASDRAKKEMEKNQSTPNINLDSQV